MELIARLAALIPPPKIPLVRYHGVFAPRSSWRSLVTPKPPARAAKSEPCAGHAPLPAAPAPASPAPASPCAPPALSVRSLAHAEPTVRVEPTLLSVLHWGRLLEGELFATSRYVEWAVLMKRRSASMRSAARDANGGCACFPRSPTQRWCAASSII
nr:transposase [Sorangium cellulosum]